jgi:hypothetical protein
MSKPRVDAVVTHHRDSFRSGVGRFNELLGERLGVPVIGIRTLLRAGHTRPLLSFKLAELAPAELAVLEQLVETRPFEWELFLHVYDGHALEEKLVRGAEHVHAGNHEVFEQVRGLARSAHTLWSPGLILDERPFPATDISVFSFGMAHKIRTDLFERLRELLEGTGRSYAVYLSAANHETTRMRDAHVIFYELHEIFPSTLYFLGNLSDVGIYNYLRSSTFFATFFLGGVRANNGSVAAAMERGAVVITNLDEHSPPEFVHMDNLIDIGQTRELPLEPDGLESISRRARETAPERGWDALVDRIR